MGWGRGWGLAPSLTASSLRCEHLVTSVVCKISHAAISVMYRIVRYYCTCVESKNVCLCASLWGFVSLLIQYTRTSVVLLYLYCTYDACLGIALSGIFQFVLQRSQLLFQMTVGSVACPTGYRCVLAYVHSRTE